MVLIRVGFEKYHYTQLGFEEAFSIPTVERDYHELYVHILKRIGEPVVVITESQIIPVAAFADARTPTADYPTLPFIRMLEILEKQQGIFMEKIAEAMREEMPPCCSAYAYVEDILGLLRFALQRRGEDIDDIDTWPTEIAKKLGKIRKAIKKAEKPAPSLGNFFYVEIAERAYQLLRIVVRFILLPQIHSFCCSCSC